MVRQTKSESMDKNNKNKSRILVISPHTKVKLEEVPTEGVESRVSHLVRLIAEDEDEKVIIIEPSDLKNGERLGIRYYFYAFDFIKIKNMRLGSYLLSLNPFYYYTLFRVLKKHSFSKVLISNPWGVFSTYIVVKKIFGLDLPIIQDSHNVESKYAKIVAKDKNIPWIIRLFYLATVGFIEKLALRYSDYTFAISHENKETFVKQYKIIPEKIVVLPPVINFDKYSKIKRTKKSKNQIQSVFHGIYRTVQNREAIEIIKNQLAKRFKKYKNFKFIVFGKGVPIVEEENFKSLGFVEDVHKVLASCDMAVVPLVSGEGVKLKVLDYMAAGLPIVTTKKGAEGLDLVNGKHAIIVDDVNEEFVKAIEYLIENPKVRRKLGHNVRKLFEKKYKGTNLKEIISQKVTI